MRRAFFPIEGFTSQNDLRHAKTQYKATLVFRSGHDPLQTAFGRWRTACRDTAPPRRRVVRFLQTGRPRWSRTAPVPASVRSDRFLLGAQAATNTIIVVRRMIFRHILITTSLCSQFDGFGSRSPHEMKKNRGACVRMFILSFSSARQ